jgi:hypothetical protein
MYGGRSILNFIYALAISGLLFDVLTLLILMMNEFGCGFANHGV